MKRVWEKDVSDADLYAVEKAAGDISNKTVGKQATYIQDDLEAPSECFPLALIVEDFSIRSGGFWAPTRGFWF